jgi:tetratricopeptide (TPR) repeat protein
MEGFYRLRRGKSDRLLGIALKDGGYDEEALALFVAMRDKAPQDPFPRRQIGFVQSKLGLYAEASAALEQSLKLAPNQSKVWHALADGYAMTGRTDDVRRIYQRLRGLDAEHAEQLRIKGARLTIKHPIYFSSQGFSVTPATSRLPCITASTSTRSGSRRYMTR